MSDSICIGCGLCCDGTLLSHLAVADASDLGAPLQLLGVEVITASDPPAFELPCLAVVDGTCTVFHQHRPRACGQYECRLLRDHKAGILTEAAARAVIAEALALRDRTPAGDGDGIELLALLDARFR